jgi:Domain of unknown function (DUF4234)
VSDAPQGPGWWQASDGKWYPAEQQPHYPPPPPPPMASSPVVSAGVVEQFRTVVPTGVPGKARRPWVVLVFTLITLGIYGLYWQYATFKEMNDYSGQGVGGLLGLIFALLIGIVNIFLLPAEIANLYTNEGQSRPASATTGFWIFLPFVGWFVWGVKVQRALNRFWVAHGATGF